LNRSRSRPATRCSCSLAQIDATAASHRHFEFFWFLYSDLALTKTLDIVDAGPGRKDKPRAWLRNMVLDNLAF